MKHNVERFSIRKLTVGAASVLIGVSFMATAQQAKADAQTPAAEASQVETAKDAAAPAAAADKNTLAQADQDVAKKTAADNADQKADPAAAKKVTAKNTIAGDTSLDTTKHNTSTIKMTAASGKQGYSAIFDLGVKMGNGVVLQGPAANVANGKVYYTTNVNTGYYFKNNGQIVMNNWLDADKITDWTKVVGVLLVNDPGQTASADLTVAAKLDPFTNSLKKTLTTYTKDLDGLTVAGESLNFDLARTVKYVIYYQLSTEDITVSKDHPYYSEVNLLDPVIGYGKSGETISFNLLPTITNKYGTFRFAGLDLNHSHGQKNLSTDAHSFMLGNNDVVLRINYKMAQPNPVVRTIKDYNQGDDQAPKETKQTVRFVEKIYAGKNGSQLEQEWNYLLPSITDWQAYTPAGRKGYTAHIYLVNADGTKNEIKSIDQVKVNHDDVDVNIEIHYTAPAQPTNPVEPEPEPNPQPNPDPEPQPDQPVEPPMPNPQTPEKPAKPAKKHAVVYSGKVNKENPVATKAAKAPVAKAATLPQTSEDRGAAGILGLLAVVFSFFGLSLTRKHN